MRIHEEFDFIGFGRSVRRGAVGALCLLVGVAAPISVAFGQEAPSPADAAAAEALFRDGRALLEAGKLTEACPKLAESQRLQPKPGTILNLAVCHERQGKTATAWANYMEAASLAARLKQPEREKAARAQAAALDGRQAKLTITLEEAPPGIALSLDKRALSAAVAGTPIPLDPGDHEVVASAPGRKSFQVVVTMEPGPSAKTLSIPRLEEERAAQPPPPPAPPGPPTPPPPPIAPEMPKPQKGQEAGGAQPQNPRAGEDASEESAGSGRKTAAYIVGGVGAAGVLVGSIFGGLTLVKKGDANDECDGRYCSKKGLDLFAEATTMSTVSTVAFGVGLAGLGAGVVLFLTADSGSPKAPKASAFIAPAIGPGIQGVSLSGAW